MNGHYIDDRTLTPELRECEVETARLRIVKESER